MKSNRGSINKYEINESNIVKADKAKRIVDIVSFFLYAFASDMIFCCILSPDISLGSDIASFTAIE